MNTKDAVKRHQNFISYLDSLKIILILLLSQYYGLVFFIKSFRIIKSSFSIKVFVIPFLH